MSSPYLILAPTQHGSIPTSPAVASPITPSSTSTPDAAQIDEEILRASRSDSMSSNASSTFRFLKLGPVHFGGEPGTSDFAD